MLDSRSWTEILIFNHHLPGPLTSSYKTLFIKNIVYFNFLLTKMINSFMKILFIIAIKKLCEDTGCNPEDLPEAMNDRKKWRERVRDIRTGGTTWWWWWWWLWYNITHSSNQFFSRDHTFFFNYLQFYASRKALVIKTNAFTIIINPLFFTNPN